VVPKAGAAPASGLTVVKVPGDSVRSVVGADGKTYGAALQTLTAVVDSRICAAIPLTGPANTDSDGNKVLVIGTDDQPLACRQQSGSIAFYVSYGIPLLNGLQISPGQTLQLHLIIAPPIDPGPIEPQTRFFVHITVQADGQMVKGTGVPGQGPSLLIVPKRLDQPLSIADTLPYTFPIEPNGRLDLALPSEPQLATYNNTQFVVAGATSTIAVQSSQLLSFPAVELSRGDVTLVAVSGQVGEPPPSITAPAGGGAVVPPTVGDGGLK
jgi:hypothetical protein